MTSKPIFHVCRTCKKQYPFNRTYLHKNECGVLPVYIYREPPAPYRVSVRGKGIDFAKDLSSPTDLEAFEKAIYALLWDLPKDEAEAQTLREARLLRTVTQ